MQIDRSLNNRICSVDCSMFRPLRLADSDEVYFSRFIEVLTPDEPVKYNLVGKQTPLQFRSIRNTILLTQRHFSPPLAQFFDMKPCNKAVSNGICFSPMHSKGYGDLFVKDQNLLTQF